MSIAVGTPEEMAVKLSEINPEKYIGKLAEKKFNGYICVTVAGKTGMEDGLIFFENGGIKLSNYEYFKYNTEYKKEQGLERSLNALKAKFGVIDLFSVTEEQTKLIKTLKEEELISKPKLQIPKEFSYKFEEQLIKKDGKESLEDSLKKYGITSLRTTEASRESLMYKAKKEDIDIERLVNR